MTAIFTRLATAALAVALLTPVLPAAAQDQTGLFDGERNVFFFGGRFHSHWFWDTFWPFGVPYEDNYFLGAGAQQYLWSPTPDLDFGVEAGVGTRFGAESETSFEAWGGGVARYGFDVFDKWRVSTSLTLGLSFVTAPIGIEAKRAKSAPKPVDMLVYMAPEIAVSPLDNPDFEVFYRIQHRSGGLGLIMSFDGSNAATAGVRFKF